MGSSWYLGVNSGSATSTVSQQLKDAKVQDHLAIAGERGREYGAKGWGLLKSAYASVASGVESVARENGYKVDLGEPASHSKRDSNLQGIGCHHATCTKLPLFLKKTLETDTMFDWLKTPVSKPKNSSDPDQD